MSNLSLLYKDPKQVLFAADIQTIINLNITDKEKLHEIGRYISIYSDQVMETGEFQGIKGLVKCYRYKITTPPVEKGKFVVPTHKDIPSKYHGKIVDDRLIEWNQEDE